MPLSTNSDPSGLALSQSYAIYTVTFMGVEKKSDGKMKISLDCSL